MLHERVLGINHRRESLWGFFDPSPLFTYCMYVSHRKKKSVDQNTSLNMSRSMYSPESCVHHKRVGHTSWRSWWWRTEHVLDGHRTEHLCCQRVSTPLETLSEGCRCEGKPSRTPDVIYDLDLGLQAPAACVDIDISTDIRTYGQEPKVKMVVPVAHWFPTM